MRERTILRRSRPVARRIGLAGVALALAASCGGPPRDEWAASSAGRGAGSAARLSAGGTPRAARADFGARGAAAAVASKPAATDPAARLFVKNCATCHGEDGSGKGPSVLDRPARNFKDGGFSFGNTAEAIFNTISYGIPGTPMPSFGEALAEPERRQLAAYVRTLGPPAAEVAEADTILTVSERTGPRVVRGILPPIVDGAPLRPRGLLVGLPGGPAGGLSFEYRIDDVRLLGVRQGGFARRTDWDGRGGTPLEPLGGLIWTDDGGDPPPSFARELLPPGVVPGDKEAPADEPEPFRARLDETSTWPGGVRLGYWLVSDRTGPNVEVRESLWPLLTPAGSGFGRRFSFDAVTPGFPPREPASSMAGAADRVAWLRASVAVPAGSSLVESFGAGNRSGGRHWRILRRPDGVFECIGVRLEDLAGTREPALAAHAGRLDVAIVPEPTQGTGCTVHDAIEILRLFTTTWSPLERQQLADLQ